MHYPLPPFKADAELQITGMIFQQSPWVAPFLFGLSGHLKNNESSHQLAIIYDWPIPALNLPATLTKAEKETLHLDRLNIDSYFSLNATRYKYYEPGGDPPDFYITEPEGKISLDLAQFTLGVRRQANALFEKIKMQIYREKPSRFSHLVGNMIYLNFGVDGEKPILQQLFLQ